MNTKEARENKDMPQGFSIAIDGPVAAGKGTVSLTLADRLSGFFLNTGSMYRAVALLCLERGIDIGNEEIVAEVLPDIDIDFRGEKFFLNDRDVTERIRESDVSSASSVVAVYGKVRKDLVEKQQQIAKKVVDSGQVVIADGRDTVTKVLPDAALKIFLTARIEVRAERSRLRYQQMGIEKSLDEVIAETRLRDQRDTNREIDPLPSHPEDFGYWILDNSSQTEEETINIIMEELKKRGLSND